MVKHQYLAAIRALSALGLVVALLLMVPPAHAEGPSYLIVANPSVSEKFLSETDLRRIFKKQLSHWDDGTPITVLEQGGKSNARKAFYRNVLKSTADKMSLYWISQTMTHGIAPPVVHSSRRRVLSQIARTPGAIGFVSAGPANSAVRIIGSD